MCVHTHSFVCEMSECVSVYVYVYANTYTHTHTHTHMYIGVSEKYLSDQKAAEKEQDAIVSRRSVFFSFSFSL